MGQVGGRTARSGRRPRSPEAGSPENLAGSCATEFREKQCNRRFRDGSRCPKRIRSTRHAGGPDPPGTPPVSPKGTASVAAMRLSKPEICDPEAAHILGRLDFETVFLLVDLLWALSRAETPSTRPKDPAALERRPAAVECRVSGAIGTPCHGGGPRRRPPKQWPALLARGGGVHDPAQASSCATSAGRTNATERGRVVPLRLHDAVAAGGTARFCDADFFACARHVAVRCIRPAAAASASCLCGRRFQPGLRLRVAATAPYRTLWGDMCTW